MCWLSESKMRGLWVTKSWLLIVLHATSYVVFAQTPGTPNVAPPSAEVQSALGVPLSGSGALQLIDEYISTVGASKKDREAEQKLLRRIAESVQHGIEPDALTRRAVRGVTLVAGYANDPEGRRESAGQSRLFRALVTSAEQAADEAEGRLFARAAIVVIAQNRFCGIDNLEGYCRNDMPDTTLMRAAQLTRAQRRAIQATIEKLRAPREAVLPHLKIVGEDLAELIKEPANPKRWEAAGPRICEQLQLGMAAADGRIDYQWGLLANAWRAVCLARHQGQAGFITQMREATDRLKQSETDPIVLAWIAQVTELPGDPPKHPAWQVVDDPNQMKRGKPD